MDSQFFLSFPIWHVVTRRVALAFDGVAFDHADDFPTEVCSDSEWMKTRVTARGVATMRL